MNYNLIWWGGNYLSNKFIEARRKELWVEKKDKTFSSAYCWVGWFFCEFLENLAIHYPLQRSSKGKFIRVLNNFEHFKTCVQCFNTVENCRINLRQANKSITSPMPKIVINFRYHKQWNKTQFFHVSHDSMNYCYMRGGKVNSIHLRQSLANSMRNK